MLRARLLLFDEGAQRRAFGAAVVEAEQAIINDKTMIADSDRWFRSGAAFAEVARDKPCGLAQQHLRRSARLGAGRGPHRGQGTGTVERRHAPPGGSGRLCN
jgi:hypothetical protein